MTTETITPEVVAPEEQSQLLAVVQQNALPPVVAQSLQSSFAPLFAQARKVIETSRGIHVTDASQKLEIKLARECRLALRAVRVDGDKIRKALKDQSLREGRAIDGFQAILLHLTETEEKRLDDQEKFVERREATRKESLKVARTAIVVALAIDPNLYALGDMTEETFQTLVEGTKLARAAAAEAARKAEADRIAREAAEQAERERVRQENEKLRAEAARIAQEQEAAAAAWRAEKEAEAAKRAIERAAVEKELKRLADEKAEAEAQAKALAEEERRKAARAEEVARQERAEAELAARIERERDAKIAADKLAEVERAAKAEREAAEKEAARQLAEQKRLADEAAAAERKRVAEEQRVAAEKVRAEREAATKRAEETLAAAQAKNERIRKAAEEKAKVERAEKERIEAEFRAAKEEQARRVADEAEALRKAAAAPARDKLLNYANAVRALEIPEFDVGTAEHGVALVIIAQRDRFVAVIAEKAEAL